MSELHSSLLYDAATNSLASEASGDNCWTKMATASFGFTDSKEFAKELKAVEKLIKTEYKLKSMPNPWRSAKSVVLGAMQNLIQLTDSNGEILGKSTIQTKIKLAKEVLDVDGLQRCISACNSIRKYLLTLTPADKESLKLHVEEIYKLC